MFKYIILLFLSFCISNALYSQEICDNGIDDDGDGLVDLNDTTDCSCNIILTPPQSLIPNPSFEDSLCCPSTSAQLDCANSWVQASDATSDYFNLCGYTTVVNPPSFPIPEDGNGYAGFIAGTGYSEYLGACLTGSMIAGTSYSINFYCALGSGADDIDLSIFGTPNCGDLPWTGTTCPIGSGSWTTLATENIVFDTIGSWQNITITFTPNTDMNAIALGSACNTPPSTPGTINYYYVDEMTLDSTEIFGGFITAGAGNMCEDSLILTASTFLTGGTWQWYKDGIALVGETNHILDTAPYGYGAYSAVYSNSDGCVYVSGNFVQPVFPVANFSYLLNDCTGEAQFTNLSTISSGQIQYTIYNFGDWGTSPFPNPLHQYNSNGEYEVNLVVYSEYGCPDTATQIIDYDFNMNAMFEFNVAGMDYLATPYDTIHFCSYDSIFFTNLSTIANGYSIALNDWTFGNNDGSTVIDPDYIYQNGGEYTIQLVIHSNNGCTDTIRQPIVIHNIPDANFVYTINNQSFQSSNPNTFNFCHGDSINLINLSSITPVDTITNFYWEIDTTFTYNFNDSTLLFDTIGNHTIVLYVEGINGCWDRDTVQINYDEIFSPSVSIINETCYGSSDGSIIVSNINGSQIGDYSITWQDTSNTIVYTNTVTNGGGFEHQNLYSGNWTLTITNEIGCIWDSIITIGTINPIINISSTLNHPDCYGTPTGSITAFSSATTIFDFTISDTANIQLNIDGSNTANLLNAGTYYISIVDELGCINIQTVYLNNPFPSPIEPSINLTHILCNGDSTGNAIIDTVEYYSGSFDSLDYLWDPNPIGENGLAQLSNSNLPAGEHVLEIIDNNGCSIRHIYYITEPEPLIGKLEVASDTYCRTSNFQKGRGEVTVTNVPDSSGTGNIIYNWEHITTGDTGNNTTFIVDEPGWMKATLIDGNNCVFIDSIYVDSLNPVAQFSSISEQFEYPDFYEGTELMEIEFINESYNFSKPTYPLSDTTFKWNLFTNQEFTGNSNWFFSFDYNEPIDTVYEGEQIYEVCLVAKNWNGCTDTTCKEILVHEQPLLIAPNVFTPGLAPNENFFFPNEGIEQFKCLVFDRWGILVFEFNTIEDFWDGNHYLNAKPCVDGVYFYQYEAKSTNHQTFNGEGFVHLIRD